MALRQVRARMPPTGLSDSLSWVGIVVLADLAGPGLLQGTIDGKVEWLNHVGLVWRDRHNVHTMEKSLGNDVAADVV